MPAPVLITEADGNIIFANAAAAALFNSTETEMLLYNWHQLTNSNPKQQEFTDTDNGIEVLVRLKNVHYQVSCRFSACTLDNQTFTIVSISSHKNVALKPRKEPLANYHNALLDQANNFIWAVDRSRRLLYGNAAYKQALQTLTGKLLTEGDQVFLAEMGEEILKRWSAYYDRAFTGETFTIIEALPNARNNIEHAEITFIPFYEGQQLTGVTCYAKDISAETYNQQQLEATRLQLDKLMALSPDVICTVNEAGFFVSVSAACIDVCGYSPQELQGRHFSSFLHASDVERTQLASAELLSGAKLTNFENRFVTKDGRIITLQWSANYDPKERLMFCVARDITQRTIKEAQNRLNSEILKNVGQAVMALDLHCNIVYWNTAATSIYGWEENEILGQNAFDVILSDNAKQLAEEIVSEVKSGKTWTGEFLLKHKNGHHLPVYASGSPIYDSERNITGILSITTDISDRKKAEREMSLLLNNTEEAFILLDNNLHIVSFNQQYSNLSLRYLGKKVEKGTSIYNYVQPHRLEIVKGLYRRVLAGLREESEVEVYDNLGSRKIFSLKFNPARDEDGNIFGAFITGIDVTFRRQAEQQRLLDLRRNEALINTTKDLIWSVSPDFHLLAANNAFVDALMRSSGKHIKHGDNLMMANYPGEWLNFWKDLYEKALTGGSYTKEIHTPTKADRSEHWSEITFHPIKDNDVITGIACYSRNITDRKVAEQREKEVQLQQRLLTSIINSTDDAIVSVTLEGTITSWNTGAEKMFGYTEDEIMGRSLGIIIPEELVDEEQEIITKIRQNQNLHHFETERIAKGGRRINVLLTVSPILDFTGQVIGASKISKDITDRKKAEEKVRKSEMQLAEAQHVAKIGSWEMQLDTLALSWSAENWRIFEVPIQEHNFSYSDFLQMVHADDREKVNEAFRASYSDYDKQHVVEHCIITPNGKEKVVEERWQIVRNQGNKVVSAIGTCQDITDRVHAEQSNNFKAKLLNTIGQATVATDTTGQINYWNLAAEKIYGYQRSRGFGQKPVALIIFRRRFTTTTLS